METKIKKTKTVPVVDSMPLQAPAPVYIPEHTYDHKKHSFWIIFAVVMVIIAIFGGYVIWKKYHPGPRTPVQTLNDLRLSSGPDTKTVQQKATTITTLEKGSQKTSLSDKEQLQLLNSLRQ